MEEKFFEIELDVPHKLLESNYQHLHHADALKFLEQGRVAFLAAIKQPLESFFAKDLFLVISRLDVLYRREVRSGKCKVRCSSVQINDKVVSIKQQLFNERNKFAIDAIVESQFLDRQAARAVLPPDDFVEAVRCYFEPIKL